MRALADAFNQDRQSSRRVGSAVAVPPPLRDGEGLADEAGEVDRGVGVVDAGAGAVDRGAEL
jgi:hypothetical protein